MDSVFFYINIIERSIETKILKEFTNLNSLLTLYGRSDFSGIVDSRPTIDMKVMIS